MFALFDPEHAVQISRGVNLPHWYQPGVSYFVTFRTDDSIPTEVSRQWHEARQRWLAERGIAASDISGAPSLDRFTAAERNAYHDQFSKAYLEALDKGLGDCPFRQPRLASIVAETLRHFDGDRYHLGDFVVMPNHVHLIVGLLKQTEIRTLCASWKRFSATRINKLLGTKGRFWQEESFDHLIRSPKQFEAIRRYIADNPSNLKAGKYLLYQREGNAVAPK